MSQEVQGVNQAPVLRAFRKVKGSIESAVKGFDYAVRSSGTKTEELKNPIDLAKGFWEDFGVVSKPPRWLLHVDVRRVPLEVTLAANVDGVEFPGARNIGYINNGDGKCVAFVGRILPLFRVSDDAFELINDWEWLLVVTFGQPLPAGTSSQTLYAFDRERLTVRYNQHYEGQIELLGIVKAHVSNKEQELGGRTVTYEEVTEAIKTFLTPEQVGRAAAAGESEPGAGGPAQGVYS